MSIAILTVTPGTRHVHSDNAWIDSGTGFHVVGWDRDACLPTVSWIDTGRCCDDDYPAIPAPDACDRDRELFAIHAAAAKFVRDVLADAAKAYYIHHGCIVEVYKGRKCPKGTYEVVKHAPGDYGAYVNLRSTSGTYHSFISVGNIRVVQDWQKAFASRPSTEGAFLAKIASDGFQKSGWLALADFVRESSGDDYADALIRVIETEKNLSPSTYHADCHNEFRTPFAGR